MIGDEKNDTVLADPIVIRVNNGKHTPAYIRLFDANFDKQGCIIDTPEMADPTIGKLVPYSTLLREIIQKNHNVELISIWCPNIPMNLDLFTLHLYDNFDNDDEHFQNLRIFYPILDKFQVQGNILDFPCKFTLTSYSRFSFLMPAMSNALFYLWPPKDQ
jgi:hypothetical protein